jgi:two-component system, OmpR family, sensor histidine kinase TctE
VISDWGHGIDTALRERLFQPFSAGAVQSGSGLGLAICAEIVQALHGAIEMDNRLELGQVVGLDAKVRIALHGR